jgi:hypothetical protein
MQIQVESHAGYRGVEMPRRFRLDRGRDVEIIESVDQWHDYLYFKVKGDDGNIYILRFDAGRAVWELTLFRTPRAETFATQVYAKK